MWEGPLSALFAAVVTLFVGDVNAADGRRAPPSTNELPLLFSSLFPFFSLAAAAEWVRCFFFVFDFDLVCAANGTFASVYCRC